MLKLTNNNYCGTVVEITKIIPLENCDNVCHANVFGNLCVVSKETKEGDVGIYFPVECKLSKEFLSNNNLYRHAEHNVDKEKKGYMEDNGRIRAVKFRGNVSNGFFIPLSSLDFLGGGVREKLKIGDEFNFINDVEICEKYVVKRKNQSGLGGKNKKSAKEKMISKVVDGHFRHHYDTDQLGKNIHHVKPESLISISNKKHGTSSICANTIIKKKLNPVEKLLKTLGVNIPDTEYGMLYSSRRVIKNEWFDNRKLTGFYKEDIWGITAKEIYPYLKKGITVYYEIVGYTPEGSAIQGGFSYGCQLGEHKIYVYRVTYTNTDGDVFEFSAKQVQDWCVDNGFNPVPQFYYGYAKDLFPELEINNHWQENFLEKLKETYLEKDCPECNDGTPDEGIVLRIEGNQVGAFKLKSFRFLQKESKDLDKGEVNIEEDN